MGLCENKIDERERKIAKLKAEIEDRIRKHRGIEAWKALEGLKLSRKQAEDVWGRLGNANKVNLLLYLSLSEFAGFMEENYSWIAEKIKKKGIIVNTAERMQLFKVAQRIDARKTNKRKR